MGVNRILPDLGFSTDFEVRQQALATLTQRIQQAAVSQRQALAWCGAAVDPHQDAVIRSTAQTIRMVAPAGAGKTQTILNRLLYRVAGQQLDPARALLLTFDNAAVNSIRMKLRDRAGAEGDALSKVRIATLNAYGYSLLREYFPDSYRPVVETGMQYGLIRQLRQEAARRHPRGSDPLPEFLAFRFYLEFFAFLKNNLFDPRAVDAQAFAEFLLQSPQAEVFFASPDRPTVTRAIQTILWMFQGYDALLRQAQVLDFDDQKLRSYALLHQHAEALAVVQGQWDEVIVDEFQDINRLDFVLVEAIARQATLVVTGDDDQAIYGFRGCSPDYIIDLDRHLARPFESHELQINYRCPPLIVEHADRLIRHNQRRIPKSPRAASDTAAQIHVVSSVSAALEAAAVVALIQRVKSETPALGYRDFVVLYRTNAQSLPLQMEFILSDIPYYVRKEDNLLRNEHLDKFLSILRVKLALDEGANPAPLDGARAVCAYFRYIERADARQIETVFRRGGSFWELLESRELRRHLPEKGRDRMVDDFQALLELPSLPIVLQEISVTFRGLKGLVGSLEDVVEEKMPLGEIHELALRFGDDIRAFVEALTAALERARQTSAGTHHRDGVPLLTYFRSKGLQWHTAILTTCNDGLIPHQLAEVEEERRLLYVAMTRASSNLVLSYVESVCGSKVAPSRFLYEAGLLQRPARPAAGGPVQYVSSDRAKTFHLSTCAKAVKIAPYELIRYATRGDAVDEGKRPCGKCRP